MVSRVRGTVFAAQAQAARASEQQSRAFPSIASCPWVILVHTILPFLPIIKVIQLLVKDSKARSDVKCLVHHSYCQIPGRTFCFLFSLQKSDPILFALNCFYRDVFQYLTSISSFQAVAYQVSTGQIWDEDYAVVLQSEHASESMSNNTEWMIN